jgi:hypothetical protein
MTNSLKLSLCIADINELLTKALREHVLRNGDYDVAGVFWDSANSVFDITLKPREGKPAVICEAPGLETRIA